jgi:hypothetical protein
MTDLSDINVGPGDIADRLYERIAGLKAEVSYLEGMHLQLTIAAGRSAGFVPPEVREAAARRLMSPPGQAQVEAELIASLIRAILADCGVPVDDPATQAVIRRRIDQHVRIIREYEQ